MATETSCGYDSAPLVDTGFENTHIIGPIVIGERTIIEDGTTVDRSIIWDDSVIGSGAVLREAIVGNGYTTKRSRQNNVAPALEAVAVDYTGPCTVP
jgi:NDP-sugar pyrophosphorylase family protein